MRTGGGAATHDLIVHNPGVPSWWPAFCLTFDVGAAAIELAPVHRHVLCIFRSVGRLQRRKRRWRVESGR
jgi:hypothetical protein